MKPPQFPFSACLALHPCDFGIDPAVFRSADGTDPKWIALVNDLRLARITDRCRAIPCKRMTDPYISFLISYTRWPYQSKTALQGTVLKIYKINTTLLK